MNLRDSRLAKNTGFLYLLSLSSQIINFALIPFETRVLGSSAYGVVASAVSLSSIMVIVLDFGFILSATECVVKAAHDKDALSSITWNVLAVKMFLSTIVGLIVLFLTMLVSPFKEFPAFFWLYFAAYAVNAALPDFLYRGLEDMKAISIRSVATKIICALPIFFVLDGPMTMWTIPAFLLLGNGMAVVYSYWDVRRRYGIRYRTPQWGACIELFRAAFPFFVSRFASTFYQSMNVVILGVLYPGQPVVGQYGASEKFLSYVKFVSSPVADSLYPYMIRTKNYRLCIKVLVVSSAAIGCLAVGAWVFAEPICVFIFGEGYQGAAVLLRCLLPAMLVIFPTYILCFPMLVPMGLSDWANRSNIVGAVIQLGLLLVLFASDSLTAESLCIAASISEASVFLFRLYAVVSHRRLLSGWK